MGQGLEFVEWQRGKVERWKTTPHLRFRKLLHFLLRIAQLFGCCLLIDDYYLVLGVWCVDKSSSIVVCKFVCFGIWNYFLYVDSTCFDDVMCKLTKLPLYFNSMNL